MVGVQRNTNPIQMHAHYSQISIRYEFILKVGISESGKQNFTQNYTVNSSEGLGSFKWKQRLSHVENMNLTCPTIVKREIILQHPETSCQSKMERQYSDWGRTCKFHTGRPPLSWYLPTAVLISLTNHFCQHFSSTFFHWQKQDGMVYDSKTYDEIYSVFSQHIKTRQKS